METRRFDINDIHVGARKRAPDMAVVSRLAESIRVNGLMNAPGVRMVNDLRLDDGEIYSGVPVLIYGHHRLLALKANDETHVECVVYESDDVASELMEIAENLHRSDLTRLERDEHLARWIELVDGMDEVLFHGETKPQGGRPESGVRAASRELGVQHVDAHRAIKVAALTPEAKAVALEVGLADNRRALLEAAAKPAVEQAEYLRERTAPGLDTDAEEQRFWRYWASLSPAARRRIQPQIAAMTAAALCP